MKYIAGIEEFLLLEKSYFSLKKDDILSKSYMRDIMRDDFVEYYLNDYIEDNDLDEDDKDEIGSSEDYKNYIYRFLSDNYEEAMENIYDSIDGNTITIYRAMTVSGDYIKHIKKYGKRLGIYWSWDENGAETHWGDYSKKSVVVIVSELDEKYVNWKETLEMNIHPSFMEEKEIRLYKNTPLTIKSIYFDGEEVDLGELEGIKFIA